MADYEQAAYNSLSQLNLEQEQELADLKRKIISDYPIIGKPINKKIIDYKNKEKALTLNQQYDAADKIRRKREALEEADMEHFVKQDIQKLVAKEEVKLKIKHEIALTALMKRIQRDRNEQLLHRQVDSKRMIQRSKNLMQHIQKKHEMEMKKTKEFLHYSLGTRGQSKPNPTHSRSQSTKRKKLRKVKAIEMSQEPNKTSFFITDRGDTLNLTKGIQNFGSNQYTYGSPPRTKKKLSKEAAD